MRRVAGVLGVLEVSQQLSPRQRFLRLCIADVQLVALEGRRAVLDPDVVFLQANDGGESMPHPGPLAPRAAVPAPVEHDVPHVEMLPAHRRDDLKGRGVGEKVDRDGVTNVAVRA